MSSKRAVVIGASAGVGRALADRLAADGYDLVLAARDERDLQALCRDLSARHGRRASSLVVDLCGEIDARAFVDDCRRRLGEIDAVLAPAGAAWKEDDGLAGPECLAMTVRVNYLNLIALIAEFSRVLLARGRGTIVGFSSIAAGAPRGRRMAYSSAKAGLEAYLRALRHYVGGRAVLVQCYVLGYIDSAMTFGEQLPLRPAPAEALARRVVRSLGSDIGTVFYPRYWRWILFGLNALPWFVYKRLRF